MANCRYVASTDGRFVTVRALRHIHEGEQLAIDYNDVLLGNFVSIYRKYLTRTSARKWNFGPVFWHSFGLVTS